MTQHEKGILEKINHGDREIFNLVFKKYFPGLCILANDYVREYEVAEDLVQEVFISFWESRDKIQINSSLKAYLYRSVHNRCLNYIRNSNSLSNKIIPLNNLTMQSDLLLTNISDAVFDTLYTEQAEEELSTAIENLPEKCRQIFQMCRQEHLSYSEVAERLDLSTSTVKTQMSRAIDKLLESVKKYF